MYGILPKDWCWQGLLCSLDCQCFVRWKPEVVGFICSPSLCIWQHQTHTFVKMVQWNECALQRGREVRELNPCVSLTSDQLKQQPLSDLEPSLSWEQLAGRWDAMLSEQHSQRGNWSGCHDSLRCVIWSRFQHNRIPTGHAHQCALRQDQTAQMSCEPLEISLS